MRRTLRLLVLALGLASPLAAQATARIGDLVTRPGDIPRRLVGYGLVVGLDGTGDRSWGTNFGATPTVRSVSNLLRRFNIEVPAERMRLRDVAAVLVTAEVSPWLRSGGRFEVQVAALGDAVSLRGGVLWMTPLVADPNQPPVATAQGPLAISTEEVVRYSWRGTNSARIPEGGVLEVDPPPVGPTEPRLHLRRPDLATAERIAAAINAAYAPGTARADDPGSVSLNIPAAQADTRNGFLASLDTLLVTTGGSARIVIDAREGTVVAGGDVRIGTGTVSHRGITLQIGGAPAAPPGGGAPPEGLVQLAAGVSVRDVVAGLHAAGARPPEMAAIFDALASQGAIRAQVVIR